MQIKMKHFDMLLNEEGLTKTDIDYLKIVLYDINPKGRESVAIQVGWIFYYLSEKEGKYQLFVNELNDLALRLTDELQFSLNIHKEQRRFLKEHGMSEESSAFHQKIVCDRNVLSGNSFYMERTFVDDESDSGWFIGSLDDQLEQEYEAIYAHELLGKKPSLIPFLMAPYGTLIIIKENDIVSIVNENNEELVEHREI